MKQTGEFYIGLMSGTSVDGIDAALVEFQSSKELSVVETLFTPFPDDLRADINAAALNNGLIFEPADSPLHTELASHYAAASLKIVEQSGLSKTDIKGIANHGQTVRHEPNADPAFSIQLGDGQLIANATGIPTICQFRQADLAAGGQGAPLMPAFHNEVFKRSSNSSDTFVLNLGGIGNLSSLGSDVIGFDTGPGNCLLDQWIEQHKSQRFDDNGQWAAKGTVLNDVLVRLLDDQYFELCHPKSTGTDYFNLSWLSATIPETMQYKPNDVQATLIAFTVETVALALTQLDASRGELYVCGGGARNQYLMQSLEQRLSAFSVKTTDELGVPSDWVESVGFAWLGYCFNHNIPSNLPSVTGASRQVVLGTSYTPAANTRN